MQSLTTRAGLAFAIGVLALAGAAPAQDTTRAKPSFVVMLADDLGYNELGCFGHPEIKTPNLDRLAADGMKLPQCYVAAPVCSPARAALLTGRLPHRYGIDSHIGEGSTTFLSTKETTIARLLKPAGYATCHVGKWHLNGKFNSPEHAQPNDHGFDHWFSTQASTEPNNSKLNHRLAPSTFVRNGTPVGALKGHSAALMVDEAVSWLKGLKPDQPFFLCIWFHSPHIPLAASEEFLRLYPKRPVKFADITEMDFAAGRLLKALDDLQRRDDTMVFFTSDNGPLNKPPGDFKPLPGSVGPLHGAKFELYEGGIRIPGIMRWPQRIRPGQVCPEAVHHWDLLPTVCEVVGLSPPADRPIDGTSLVPIFQNKPLTRKTPLFWMTGGSALLSGDWKLLKLPKKTELFNLKKDPLETTDLSEKESERLKQMSAELDTLTTNARKSRYVSRN